MKLPVSTTMMALILTLAGGATLAAEAPQARTPIKPIGDCMRIDQINEWHIVDNRTAIVRTGPKRYRVDLQSDCPRLGIGPAGLIFRPNQSNAAIDATRICGEVGETVHSRNQPPCAIQAVRIIDKAEFDRLSAQSRRSGSGADQPTGRP